MLGTGFAVSLYEDVAREEAARREQQTRRALEDAAEALLGQMHNQNDRHGEEIATNVLARHFLLPCPDNVGDNNLDGVSDIGTSSGRICSDDGVRPPLAARSRFGRWPWRTHIQNNPGTDIQTPSPRGRVKDSSRYDVWYALSRNVAPQPRNRAAPLHLHQLGALTTGWLTVYARDAGGTLSRTHQRAAAVVLSPGRPLNGQRRLDENHILTMHIPSSSSLAKSSPLRAENYFESIEGDYQGATLTIQNFNADETFVHNAAPPPRDDANDSILAVDYEDLLSPSFLRGYLFRIGANIEVHNAPIANTPLANLQNAARDFYRAHDFYPAPARFAAANITAHARDCAAWQTSQSAPVTLPAGAQLFAAAPLTLAATLLPVGVTATITAFSFSQPANFLLGRKITAQASAFLLLNDDAVFNSGFTLGRNARVSLTGALLLPEVSVNTSPPVLPSGAGARLFQSTTARAASGAPLESAPPLGLWGARAKDGAALRHHSIVSVAADTRGGMPGGARLRYSLAAPQVITITAVSVSLSTTVTLQSFLTLTAATFTVSPSDEVMVRAGGRIVIKNRPQSGAPTPFPDGLVVLAATATITLPNPDPLAESYLRARTWFYLNADTRARLPNQTITAIAAPAMLHPWRDDNARHNVRAWPPCQDREFSQPAEMDSFADNHPIYYAVAAGCAPGNNAGECAAAAGLEARLAEGAKAALPAAHTLTLSATLNINGASITLQGGTARMAAAAVTISQHAAVSLDGFGAELLQGFVFRAGAPVVLPRGVIVRGGANSKFTGVRALMMFSPAPLPRVMCAPHDAQYDPPGAAVTATLNGAPVTLLRQEGGGINSLADQCRWLDHPENVDGDSVFIMQPYDDFNPPQSNDYFLLLGGRLEN